MPNSIAKTAANKKWYELNKAKHNVCCIKHRAKYYASNKEILCEKARMKYLLKKEFLILRNIDLF